MKTWLMLCVTLLGTGALAIKKKPAACEDDLEHLRTELRLRTAELVVARGQVRGAERRLAICQKKESEP